MERDVGEIAACDAPHRLSVTELSAIEDHLRAAAAASCLYAAAGTAGTAATSGLCSAAAANTANASGLCTTAAANACRFRAAGACADAACRLWIANDADDTACRWIANAAACLGDASLLFAAERPVPKASWGQSNHAAAAWRQPVLSVPKASAQRQHRVRSKRLRPVALRRHCGNQARKRLPHQLCAKGLRSQPPMLGNLR